MVVLGELTKMMQDSNISYTILKDKIQEKKNLLNEWLSTPSPFTIDQHVDNNSNSTTSTFSCAWGPSLSKYIQLTSNQTYGAFFVDTKDRRLAEENCRSYIERFLIELDRRFPVSKVQESLCSLFDPAYLQRHEQRVRQIGYGREQVNFLSRRYNQLDGFDSHKAATEWESLRPSLISYISIDSKTDSRKLFWKEFTLLQRSISMNFDDDYKNVMLLVNVYLVSPTNSAECERGFSASNRIQTNGRSRLMITTLSTLLTVRLLLPDDVRRYEHNNARDFFFYWMNILANVAIKSSRKVLIFGITQTRIVDGKEQN